MINDTYKALISKTNMSPYQKVREESPEGGLGYLASAIEKDLTQIKKDTELIKDNTETIKNRLNIQG